MSWDKKLAATISITGISIDPVNTSTVYLEEFNDLRRSTDGGNTWQLSPLARDPEDESYEQGPLIQALLIDPKNTSTLYVGASSDIFKSTDGARSWTRLTVDPARPYFSLSGIDPTNTATLYASAYNDGPYNQYKSIDGGRTWRLVGQLDSPRRLSIDPANPSVIYVGTGDGELKSTDGGLTWNVFPTENVSGDLFIHPQSSALYITTNTASDVFVAKVSPDGASLMASTYLGGYNYDSGQSVVVDSAGNIYVAGQSWSTNFPTRSGAFSVTYGGGSESFLIKFGAPRITGVSIKRKALSVAGENFDRGATILLNGKQQKTESDETSPTAALISKKAGKRIAVGDQAIIQVQNSDGTLSLPFSFTRPAGL